MFANQLISLNQRDARFREGAAFVCEAVEPRVLLVTFFVTGTPGPDTIDLVVSGGLVTATVNGVPTSMADATVTDVVIDALAGADTVTLRSNGDNPVNYDGGGGADSITVGGAGNGAQGVLAAMTIVNPDLSPSTTIALDDGNDVLLRTVSIDVVGAFTEVSGLAPAIIRFASADTAAAEIITGMAGDNVRIHRNSVNLTLSSAAGTDFARVGSPGQGLAGILGPLTFQSESGTPVVRLEDSGNALARSTTIDVAAGFTTVSGFAPALIRFSNARIGAVLYQAGSAIDRFDVLRSGVVTTITNTGGEDVVHVGNGTDGTQSITANLTVLNPPSFTTLTLDNSADAVGRDVLIDTILGAPQHGRISGLAPGVIDYRAPDVSVTTPVSILTGSGADSITVTDVPNSRSVLLSSGGGNDTVQVINTGMAAPLLLDAGPATDSIRVSETAPDGPLSILPSSGEDAVEVNADGAGSATVLFDATQRLGDLSVGAGGSATLTAGPDKVLTVRSLSISSGGRLDLTNQAMIIDYVGGTPIDSVAALLTSGYDNGAWTGSGIVSSTAAASGNTAVGFAEATDLFSSFPAIFAGQNVDDTSILLRHTLYGDADLNRTVNLDDFNRLAANFGQDKRRWSQGDFDFSSAVNLDDFNRLAANFGQTAMHPASVREIGRAILMDIGGRFSESPR